MVNSQGAQYAASFEWVGHAISPYLGFLAGWLMIAGNLIGTTASTAVLGPSVLAVAGQNAASTWPDIAISTAVIVVMLVIAVAGIRITARTQAGMAAVEYAILAGFAVLGFVAVLGHHHGTFPVTKGWFSLSGIGGKGSLASGLPAFLGRVSARFKTPAIGSILTGLTLIAILWAYLLSSSIASAFTQLIDVTGILTAGFYILTALATIVYYRRRVFSNAWDALLAGVLPFAAAAFLAWIVVRSLQAAPASQRLSVAGIIAVGMVLMLVARFALRSPFFQIRRESASREP